MTELMKDLISLSREYGSDPAWVVAGGGNTSLKEGDTLFVKASGYSLATIGEEGFARMDRRKLAAIWEKDYPAGEDAASVAERERLVLADMMASREPGEERRPSVETQLHDLLPWPLVVHLHPTMVNGLTCSVDGKAVAEELFGDAQVWIPVTDPGYVLVKAVREALEERAARGMDTPEYIILANHGVFAGGADAGEIRERYSRLAAALESRVTRHPGAMPVESGLPGDAREREKLEAAARHFFGEDAGLRFVSGGELAKYLENEEAALPLTECLTPDHIVYAGPGALYLGDTGGSLAEAWLKAGEEYRQARGKPANLILAPSAGGALVCASGAKALENAAILLDNALEVAAFTESFGGILPLEERFIRFIVEWEVENYRSSVAAG